MSPGDVKALVDEEIRRGPMEDPHGVLPRCLVSVPERRMYRDDADRVVELWLVVDDESLQIVFDEESRELALAIPGEGAGVVIGRCGSFRDVVEGM